MIAEQLTLALIRDVFHEDPDGARLVETLTEARHRGAELAVLPEIPLNPWSPATKNVREEDCEPPGGPRHLLQAAAAKEAGIALVGGAIVREPETGRRFNTALCFDAEGRHLQSYRKVHIPEEPGFWESSHYEAGSEPAVPVEGLPWPIGVQICSDFNRPMGSHALAARGAMLIVNPRATSVATWANWKLVYRATALTACCFTASAARPGPELGVNLGAPCIVVSPDGRVLLESEERLSVVRLDAARLRAAKVDYPGYLSTESDVYARSFTSSNSR